MILAALLTGTATIAFAETEQSNIVISDAVAPMKLEVDSNSNSASETKTVTLINTGETATEYVAYVEQTSGKTNPNSNFELSKSKITVQPGESYQLEISIPIQSVNPNSEEYKLKIIRNPDTQTPVGYIIPIIFAGENGGTGNVSKGGSSSGSAASVQNQNQNQNGSGNGSNNSENKSGMNSESNENENKEAFSNEKETKENSLIKLVGVVILLLIVLLVIVGIIVRKEMKSEPKSKFNKK
ncbi:hypothetical protein [Methanimicrococcus hongohii]|uniref:hypothetical protein n=1 Tax=Methanimicrococcus hongohii TaxID=3028295 RepID=UPI00292D052B|nr:hypothetical protein [Methanimicrococcus sp. Hf6]